MTGTHTSIQRPLIENVTSGPTASQPAPAAMKKDWAEVNNRVIGHVVWAPPITGLVPPYDYTLDVCVIKLDKKKFLNFKGNAIDLGAC